MVSLLKETTRIYIWTGIFLFSVLFPYCEDSISYYNFVNVLLFVTYAITLWCALGKNKEYYSYGRLFLTVFLYSILFVGIYLEMSYYYTGDTFYWDYTDPYAYATIDKNLVDKDIPLYEQADFISTTYDWGPADWGASISQTLFLRLIPSRYFLFFAQTIIGTVGALLMFSTCKKFMKIDYAYMAALSYSIASYSIYYYASFRKEISMVFIVIACFWSFYQYLENKKKPYLALTILIAIAMIFFRPAVMILMLAGISSYYIGKKINKNNARPILFLLFIVLALSFSVIFNILNSFSETLANSENYVDTSVFGVIVSALGVMIGPFPQLLILDSIKMSQLPLYGTGLLFKFFLFLAFWNGFVSCLKEKEEKVFPLYFFTLLEMLALAVWNDGLELRKAMPHISTFYMAAFWFISKYDERAAKEEKMPGLFPLPNIKPSIIMFGTTLFIFLSSFVWNTMR